jgi:CrcB protein
MIIGALGCGARMWMSGAVANRWGESFPVGTLAVNVFGCFLVGIFATLTRPDGGVALQPIVRQAVMIGFLGGFTTFSSFALQTLALVENRQWGYATVNVGLSVLLCLLAAWIGQVLAMQFSR